MRKVELQAQTHLEIEGIEGFFVRKGVVAALLHPGATW
jgi:hypothetical protein